ncbi:MAG: hypothetical protein VYA71_00205 [Pseudomonadota bacterium]|nr:hypothetical protein [Pseudomonadota bacterium]
MDIGGGLVEVEADYLARQRGEGAEGLLEVAAEVGDALGAQPVDHIFDLRPVLLEKRDGRVVEQVLVAQNEDWVN